MLVGGLERLFPAVGITQGRPLQMVREAANGFENSAERAVRIVLIAGQDQGALHVGFDGGVSLTAATCSQRSGFSPGSSRTLKHRENPAAVAEV